MSKNCDVCTMHFTNEHTLQEHLAGKKHLKRLKQAQLLERSIIVSQIPKTIDTNKLLNIFRKYGPIKKYHINPQHLEIEFYDRNLVEILSKKPVWQNNVKLNIQKKMSYNTEQSKKIESSISYDEIKHVFNEDATFDHQLQMFLNAVQVTDAEIALKYDPVCTDMDRIFKVVFPNCEISIFGSIQTGLSLKNCDIDISMNIGDLTYTDKNITEDFNSTARIFKKVKRVLYKMNTIFGEIVLIPHAKIPIIKFCYLPTEVSCDLSFENYLGIYKSSYIKYCVSLDNRIKPLVMLIKYWAKHFKISGTGKICNYGLVLLTIFYLQQPSVNIIPPLIALRNSCEPQFVHGWQVNFNENTILPPITNQSSVAELLHGFFSFYATFKFSSYVICLIDGKIYPKLEFKEVHNLPTCMDIYKAYVNEDKSFQLNINKPMCVQDPIELKYNITSTASHCLLNSFLNYCMFGMEICTKTSKNDYKNLMETLLTTYITKNGTFSITISETKYQSNNDSGNLETCTDNVGEVNFTKNGWNFAVLSIVKDIFEQIFKVEIEVLATDVGQEQQKIEILSDIHIEKFEKIILHCSGCHCVWHKRTNHNIILDPSLSCLQKEIFITEEMVQRKDTKKIKLDFICIIEKKHPLGFILTFINENTDKDIFKKFIHFAKCKLKETINRTLLFMQQFNKCY